MRQRSAIFGFLISPLAPSVVFSIGALVLAEQSDIPLEIPLSGYVLGLFMWFLYGIIVAYPVTLIIGVPGYLIYKKYGVSSFKSYAAGGIILGALAPLLLIPIFSMPETLNMNWSVFIISSIFGFIVCATFWLLVIKNHNNSSNLTGAENAPPS